MRQPDTLQQLIIRSRRGSIRTQAKLDELIHANAHARHAITRIDEEEPETIERHRAEARRND